MRLIEKDGKGLLRREGICVPAGFWVDWDMTAWPQDRVWQGPCYLKAQVLSGRRGTEGLVQWISSSMDFERVLRALRERLSPKECAGFWCEEEMLHDGEWLLSCDIDRVTGEIRVHVSQEGGGVVSSLASYRLEELDTEQVASSLPPPIVTWLRRLPSILISMDALRIEINPVILRQEEVVALDVKIELDDAASFRHPEWASFSSLSRSGIVSSSREQAYLDLLCQTGRPVLGTYVELSGTVAMILSGGGASLVTMDALARAGGSAANYLELSGNPDPEFLRKAAMIVLSRPGIKGVWVAGSFANFTDIEATVRAILQAVDDLCLHVPIVIRRDGPGADAAEAFARVWADRQGIPLIFQRASVDLETSAQELMRILSSQSI